MFGGGRVWFLHGGINLTVHDKIIMGPVEKPRWSLFVSLGKGLLGVCNYSIDILLSKNSGTFEAQLVHKKGRSVCQIIIIKSSRVN